MENGGRKPKFFIFFVSLNINKEIGVAFILLLFLVADMLLTQMLRYDNEKESTVTSLERTCQMA